MWADSQYNCVYTSWNDWRSTDSILPFKEIKSCNKWHTWYSYYISWHPTNPPYMLHTIGFHKQDHFVNEYCLFPWETLTHDNSEARILLSLLPNVHFCLRSCCFILGIDLVKIDLIVSIQVYNVPNTCDAPHNHYIMTHLMCVIYKYKEEMFIYRINCGSCFY